MMSRTFKIKKPKHKQRKTRRRIGYLKSLRPGRSLHVGGNKQIHHLASSIASLCPINAPGACAKILPDPTGNEDYAVLEIRLKLGDDMYTRVSSKGVNTVEGTLQAIVNAYKMGKGS